MRCSSCNRAARTERGDLAARRGPPLALALALALVAFAPLPALADRQLDPGLRAVVQEAIDVDRCEVAQDRFDQEVFFKLQEPRLRPIVRDRAMRMDILRNVFCESNFVVDRYRRERRLELKLTPELVLAVIDVESHFNRYAVSSSGAVGLMQVMPFWPQQLGVRNRLFGSIGFNVRLGCEILAYYMLQEHNDYRRALGRYNGSVGRREYPDLVLTRLSNRWRG